MIKTQIEIKTATEINKEINGERKKNVYGTR